MRIVLDNIIFSLQRAGGISGAWAALIEALLKRPGLSLTFVERDDARHNIFRAALDIPASMILKARHLPLTADRYMPVRLGEDAPFLFHSSYYRTCTNPNALNVITLHDFIYEEAHAHSSLAVMVHSAQKNHALRNAAAIACISGTTKTKLLQRIKGLEHNAIIKVISNPTVCCRGTKPDAGPSGSYILYVGGRGSYKNFHIAAHAAALQGMPLVVAGAPLSRSETAYMDSLGLCYTEVVYPDNARLCQLYCGAFCLLYPSSFEGFGIPIIEAQSCGCPVIIGDSDACREVGRDSVLRADSLSAESLAACIARLRDDNVRHALIDKGLKNARRFNNNDIVNAYVSLYTEVQAKAEARRLG